MLIFFENLLYISNLFIILLTECSVRKLKK